MSRKTRRVPGPVVSAIETLEPRRLLTEVVFNINAGASELSIATSTVTNPNGGATAAIFAPNQLLRDFDGVITADVTDTGLTIVSSDLFANIPPGTDYYNFGANINNDVIEHHYTDLLFNLASPNVIPFTHADGNFDSSEVDATLVTGTLNFDNFSGPTNSPVFDSLALDTASGTLLTGNASLVRVGGQERLTLPFTISYTFSLPMYYNAGTGMRQGSETGPITNFQHTLTFVGTIVANAGFTTGTTGAIRSNVFDDDNSNAAFDAEEGLENVPVYIDANNNNILDPGETYVLTDEDGEYVFPYRDPGTYTIRHVVPEGYRLVLPANGRRLVDIVAGDLQGDDAAGDPAVFGDNTLPGTVSGLVFKDANVNGVRDGGELGLSGVRVYVDFNDNGAFNAGEPFDLTDNAGNYQITGVAAGDYTLRHVVGAGLRSIVPPGGAYDITVLPGQGVAGQDFGDADLPGTISGRIYQDVNNDGTRQVGEPLIGDVRVFLDVNGNNDYDLGEITTLSDAAGAYMFTDVIPGTYTVRHVVPAGYTLAAPVGGEYVVTVGVAEDVINRNFGDTFVGAAITGTVFEDLNENGIQDGGEAGIENVRVFVDVNFDGRFNSGERYDFTDGAGNYTLATLKPGRRVIGHLTPATYRLTSPAAGFYTIKVTSGGVVTGVNFGDTNLSAIRGNLYNDINSNGLFDFGERGMLGWIVYLDQNNNKVRDAGELTATAAKSGAYSFIGVAPGTYLIRQEQHAGWRITRPSRNLYTVTITDSDTVGARNFGNTDNIYIGGNVFTDQNGDGKRSKTELLAISNYTIYDDANNNSKFDRGEISAARQLDGTWAFTTLTSGVHNIRIIPAQRTRQTAPKKLYYSLKIKRAVIVEGLTFGIK
ncbi:MAG: hypothetical protein H7144_00935 [Burkholderiales bacterium]|nr:hypothetical protein [Phycisphaerae bacterium]